MTSSVLFVAPFYLPTTLRFVRAVAEAVAESDGVRLGVVSQEPFERLPEPLRAHLTHAGTVGHWRLDDALDPGRIVQASRALAERLGPPRRLLGVLEQLQVPLAEARSALGVPGLSVEAARNFRDKARMKTVLAAAGLPCARHRLAGSAAEGRAFAEEVGFPVVLKPPAGAGAQGTYRIDGPERLEEALAVLAPSRETPWLIEEFLSGEEHSFDVVAVEGEPVWYSVSEYLPPPLAVLENPWIQWAVLLPREAEGPPYEEIRRVGPAAVRALGMDTGLAHMEWFRRPDGSVAVSEVGARPPGARFVDLLCWAHDVDFYRLWARLVVFGEFSPPERRYAAGAAYLRAQGPAGARRVGAIEGLDEAQRELGELVVQAELPRSGQARSDSYEGDGHVVVRHPETGVVREALSRIVSLLRVGAE